MGSKNFRESAVSNFLRLSDVIGPGKPIPVSKSHWYAGIAKGHYPPPIKLGERISVWRASDIEAVIAGTWEAASADAS